MARGFRVLILAAAACLAAQAACSKETLDCMAVAKRAQECEEVFQAEARTNALRKLDPKLVGVARDGLDERQFAVVRRASRRAMYLSGYFTSEEFVQRCAKHAQERRALTACRSEKGCRDFAACVLKAISVEVPTRFR